MPTFKTTHFVEGLITHVIEADTIDEAHALAVERTFAMTRQLEKVEPHAHFGPVDDHYEPMHQVATH